MNREGMPPTQIAIYGAGGMAREVAWLAHAFNVSREVYEVVCFIDDSLPSHGDRLNGIPIMGLEAARREFPHAKVVGGVGSPQTRQLLVEKAAAAGFGFET